ncbi:tetratricopeptide repeat protein [Fulvivirgaceae bacterium PWU4]|uniref:Tetratricopeptide repeat protein n=1 Tax=Chryseosolibacter histidini TaxID=2782349 RepID=A0AAP2GHW6_9BACT|nr:tetratricopeptide repeat protein [Chryseosolibacter histidini]MBT1696504.1 tetratricopeptide repeat protein [Chryseosolibacter histidini]
MAKKVEHKHELLENPEALADKLQGAETWAERHPKTVIGVSVLIALIVGGYFGFQYFKNSKEADAQREMFQAVYYFEADSLDLALNGDGNNLGFIDIIDEYGITDAAKLANYYAGVAYLKQGKFEVARLYLEDFSSNDLLVQARAYSLIGDTYMEEGKYEDAAKYYDKAADYKPNKFFTPTYLMKAALAYEKANQNDKAKDAYDKVISEYWESSEYQNARKFKARLDSNS